MSDGLTVYISQPTTSRDEVDIIEERGRYESKRLVGGLQIPIAE